MKSRSAHGENDCGSPAISELFLRAQLHERLVRRVRELERVIDRGEPRDFAIIVEFERSVATHERSCVHRSAPFVTAALVATNNMGDGGAWAVGQQCQPACQISLNLQLTLNARVQRHVFENCVGREQLRRLCGIIGSECILERLRYLLDRCRRIHDAIVEIWRVWAEGSDGDMRLRTAAIPVVDPADDLAFGVECNGTEKAEFFTQQCRGIDEFDECAIAITDDPQGI